MKFTGRKYLLLSIACVCIIFTQTNWTHAQDLHPVQGVAKSPMEAVLSLELGARVIEAPVVAVEPLLTDELIVCYSRNALDVYKYASAKRLLLNIPGTKDHEPRLIAVQPYI